MRRIAYETRLARTRPKTRVGAETSRKDPGSRGPVAGCQFRIGATSGGRTYAEMAGQESKGKGMSSFLKTRSCVTPVLPGVRSLRRSCLCVTVSIDSPADIRGLACHASQSTWINGDDRAAVASMRNGVLQRAGLTITFDSPGNERQQSPPLPADPGWGATSHSPPKGHGKPA